MLHKDSIDKSIVPIKALSIVAKGEERAYNLVLGKLQTWAKNSNDVHTNICNQSHILM